MKCPKCGTENQGNICIKCGNHIFDNNLENSIFFKNIGDSIKSIENTSKEIMQEKEDNFNNQDKQLINEKINENKSELNQESKNQNLFDSNIHNVPINSISSDGKDKLEQNLDEMFENVISKENENNEKSNNQIIENQNNLNPVSNNNQVDNINDKVVSDNEINSKKEKRSFFKKKEKKQNNVINDSEKSDLEIFIGKNSEKIIYNKINIIPAIFGNIWLLYRKYYLAGIILSIMEFLFILYVIFLTNTPLYVYFILRPILYFLVGKEIYINYAKAKIKEIKRKNPKLERNKEIELLQKAGGTTIIAPLIYLFITIIIFIGLFFVIYNLGSYTFYEMNLKAKDWSLNGTEGLVYGDSEKTCIVDIKYGTADNDDILSKLYEKGIITEDQYLNKSEYNFDELDKETINNVEWSKLTLVDTNNIYEDVMVTEKNNALYFVNFKGYNENDYSLCQEKFIDLKSTIKFK